MDGLDDDCGDDLVSYDQKPDDTESDEFTTKDAFIFGGAMGWAYEEGFIDGIHHRRQKKVRKPEGLSREKRNEGDARRKNENIDGNYF